MTKDTNEKAQVGRLTVGQNRVLAAAIIPFHGYGIDDGRRANVNPDGTLDWDGVAQRPSAHGARRNEPEQSGEHAAADSVPQWQGDAQMKQREGEVPMSEAQPFINVRLEALKIAAADLRGQSVQMLCLRAAVLEHYARTGQIIGDQAYDRHGNVGPAFPDITEVLDRRTWAQKKLDELNHERIFPSDELCRGLPHGDDPNIQVSVVAPTKQQLQSWGTPSAADAHGDI